MKNYIETDFEKGKNFFLKNRGKGPIKMLNLLKFKSIADYSEFPSIAPKNEITGEEAYKIYMESISPLLKEAGSKILFQGKCQSYLIGPDDVTWDKILLMEHASAEAFVSFAQNSVYQPLLGHRSAALLDARLIPIT